MIEVEELSKSFGAAVAVDRVSFAARDGEVVGLLGPNGAGKTTTLRMLATVLRPSGGTARVDGRDVVREAAAVRAAIGVLPEHWGLYDRLTPREHLRYFGRLHGLRGRELERRAEAVLQRLGADRYADRRCGSLSKGMKQMVMLARALLHDPRTLLLDEPTSGLDAMAARRVRELIAELRREGRCVLVSTHLLGEAERLCDRIVVIAGGRVLADGTPAELAARTGRPSLEEAFVALVGDAGEAGTP